MNKEPLKVKVDPSKLAEYEFELLPNRPVALAGCSRLPDVPVIVSVYVPGGVVDSVETLTVELLSSLI